MHWAAILEELGARYSVIIACALYYSNVYTLTACYFVIADCITLL